MVNISTVEGLTSREAAERADVRVQQWHRLVARFGLTPHYELPGIRGAKFWRPEDVDRVCKAIAAKQVAS
jgi:hypothetical protein